MRPSVSVILFAFTIASLATAARAESWNSTATLARLKSPPKLDGIIEPGEWDGATRTVNFLSISNQTMDPRTGATWCGFTDDRLYIAMVSELPPRPSKGPYSVGTTRDADAIFDPNAIEIWIDPNRDRRESGQGDQAFYQLFVTTLGTTADLRVVPGKAPDSGWNPDVLSAHNLDSTKKIWTAEISIPFKDFGWTGPVVGHSIGVLIARNYKNPWCQVTWFPHVNAFVSWQYYPRLYLTLDEPVVTIESLGDDLFRARPDFKVKVFNPGPARKAKVKLHVTSTDMPDIKNEKELDLPAGGKADYGFAVPDGMLHVSADHHFNLHVDASDGARALFDYTGNWSHDPISTIGWDTGRRSVDNKWDIRLASSPDESLGVSLLPSYNRVRVNLNAGMMVADPEDRDEASVSSSAIVKLRKEDGSEIAKADVKWDRSKKESGGNCVIQRPDLPAGNYSVTAIFNKQPNQPIVKKFTRTKFAFEGNTIGITDTIYPPFEPVKATDSKVAVVGREYEAGDLGLWKSVKSLGTELLASSIVLRADGDRVLHGNPQLVSSKPGVAVYQSESNDVAVVIKSQTTTEVDGCTRVELQLLPGTSKSPLKSLALEIPLLDAVAPLWHVCTTQLRVNPVGAAPEGTGVVWDSTKFPDGNWIGNFKCYFWLGGVERGLCWFADNDKGWVLNYDDKRNFSPSQELIRKDGVLTLRINLVQKPVVIDAPRKIVFGLMASPGKPMRPDWRSVLSASSLGVGYEKLPTINFMGCNYWGGDDVFCAAYPRNADLSILDAMSHIPGTPGGDLAISKGNEAFVADWDARNFKPDMPVLGRKRGELVGLAGVSLNVGPGGRYFTTYWDEYHGDSFIHPERQVFDGEWGPNNMARSRQDFRAYWAAEFVKRDIGLYFDNAYPHACRDTTTSEAYEIPGLGIQPSANLWAQRDYHRRMWNIHREFGAKWHNRPLMLVHMTNTNIVPYLTWSDGTLDLEWFYGPEAQQSKYSYQLLSAQSAGRQTGCYPSVLARIDGCKSLAELRMAERSRFGVMSVHEIKAQLLTDTEVALWRLLYDLGYSTDACAVHNYWDTDYPVKADDPRIKSLLVKKGNEVLLVICTWNKDRGTADLSLDAKALGFPPTAVIDAEDQSADMQRMIAAQQRQADSAKGELEKAKKEVADKIPGADQRLPIAEAAAADAARLLQEGQSNLPTLIRAATQPIAFDAGTGHISVPLEGYGVRVIRIR